MTAAPFISWIGHGAASLAPPAAFTDAKTHVFGIAADTAAMQRLADTLLNPAGRGAVRYEAVLPVALFSFMDIAKCTSAADIVGWLPGRECAIWVPLWERHSGNLLRDRLVFWSPYIFIDYTIGMVTGREAWGWPKVAAQIAVDTDTPADPQFSCTTTLFRTLAATTRGETAILYRITRTQPAARPAQVWHSAGDAIAGLIGSLAGETAAEVAKTLHLQPHLPSVVLKQFRQPGAPELACYQAIVDSPITPTGFSGGGLLFDIFELEITTCESHAIVPDLLGRPADAGTTRLPVEFAAWVTFDFQALTGEDIVVATA